jgi:hypothetical protein
LIIVGSLVALHLVLVIPTTWLYVHGKSFKSVSSTNAIYESVENGKKYTGDSADPLVEVQGECQSV